MRLTEDRPLSPGAKARLFAWDLAALALGVPCGWLAAGPLHRLGPLNVVVWTITAMVIGRQAGAHLRKWARLAGFGFVVAVAAITFGAAGDWARRPWLLVLLGLGSAFAAVPSGGLIHFWMSYTYRRRVARTSPPAG